MNSDAEYLIDLASRVFGGHPEAVAHRNRLRDMAEKLASLPVDKSSKDNSNSLEANVEYLLDKCPYTILVQNGSTEAEAQIQSLVLTFNKMQSLLESGGEAIGEVRVGPFTPPQTIIYNTPLDLGTHKLYIRPQNIDPNSQSVSTEQKCAAQAIAILLSMGWSINSSGNWCKPYEY